MNKRPDWHKYFMQIAAVAATRATCNRKHVGACIVKNKRILSTGYNGSPEGLPHCDDAGHELREMGGRMSCVRTIHAEANALLQAARHGVEVAGASLYTTASPCYDCAKQILGAGIKALAYGEVYQSRYGLSDVVGELFKAGGVEVIHVPTFVEIPCVVEDCYAASPIAVPAVDLEKGGKIDISLCDQHAKLFGDFRGASATHGWDNRWSSLAGVMQVFQEWLKHPA